MAGRGRVTVRLAAGGEVRAHTITFKLSRTLGWERLWGWFGVLWSRTEEGRRKRESLDHPGCSGNYTRLTPADGTMCSLAHHFFLDEHSLYTKRLCCSDDAFVSLKKEKQRPCNKSRYSRFLGDLGFQLEIRLGTELSFYVLLKTSILETNTHPWYFHLNLFPSI